MWQYMVYHKRGITLRSITQSTTQEISNRLAAVAASSIVNAAAPPSVLNVNRISTTGTPVTWASHTEDRAGVDPWCGGAAKCALASSRHTTSVGPSINAEACQALALRTKVCLGCPAFCGL
jgi:hypothetical protein